MSTLLTMCLEFFKTGLFAVGGGLATLPFLSDIQAKYGWFSLEDLANLIAVSESTPGPIGINMSTYVGYTTLGLFGGVVTSLSLVLPSLIVIMVIAKMLDKYQSNHRIQNMFTVMRPAVTGLIAAAGFTVLKLALWHTEADSFLGHFNWIAIVLFAVLCFGTQWKKTKKLHPILFIAIGAVCGILFQM